jgi:hypothetical protein
MSLAQYLKSFSHLRTYKDRKKWSALTTYQAPHKPFLLLSIMDLIAQKSITISRFGSHQSNILLKRLVLQNLCPGSVEQ